MQSLVVYSSKFGNTKKVAEAIADGLRGYGQVRLLGLETLEPLNLGKVDLLFVGGPTQLHTMTARMRQLLDALKAVPGSGMVSATFDTGFWTPAATSGSAAKTIARKLRRVGIRLFAPPESFLVRGSVPQLEEGEKERAITWARGIADRLVLSQLCAA